MCFLSYAETTFKRQRQAGRYKHTENETETEGWAEDCLEGTREVKRPSVIER